MDNNETKWFVVYTKPRWEKKVALTLTGKGIDNYCPLNKVVKQWSDRKKLVLEPLFKGYVFINIPVNQKWDIKKIDGIINFVYWLGSPAIVKEAEINTIKMFLGEFQNVQIVDNHLSINKKVLIKQGLLMNYRGIIVELSGSKAKVRIESMGIQLSAFFDKKNLEASEL